MCVSYFSLQYEPGDVAQKALNRIQNALKKDPEFKKTNILLLIWQLQIRRNQDAKMISVSVDQDLNLWVGVWLSDPAQIQGP